VIKVDFYLERNYLAGSFSGEKRILFCLRRDGATGEVVTKIFCLGACFFDFFTKNQKNWRPNIILFRRRRRRNKILDSLRKKTVYPAKNGSFFVSDTTG